MDPENRRSSSARRWWKLIAAGVVFVVGISLLERFGPSAPQSSTSAEGTHGLFSPAAPQVRRLEDGAIEIRHDSFRRTTIRLGDDDSERALFECLAQGIEETFGNGIEGWARARIGRETRRIQDECMGLHDVPMSIPLPPAGAGATR